MPLHIVLLQISKQINKNNMHPHLPVFPFGAAFLFCLQTEETNIYTVSTHVALVIGYAPLSKTLTSFIPSFLMKKGIS